MKCSEEFYGLIETDKNQSLNYLRKNLEITQEIGAKTLALSINRLKDHFKSMEGLCDYLNAASNYAGKIGLRIALQDAPWTPISSNGSTVIDLIKKISCANLGFIINSSQCLADGTQAARLRDIPKNKIFLAQLSDSARFGNRTDGTWTTSRLLPGEGVLNLSLIHI